MRKLTGMTWAELEELFEKKTALNDIIQDRVEDYILGQYKDDFLYGVDYNYNYGDGFYFYGANKNLIAHLEEMQKAFEFFQEDFYNKTVKRFIELEERSQALLWSLSEENEERLDKRIRELRDEIEAYICERMDADYEWCGTADAFASYIKDMDGNEEFDNYYVDDGHIFKEIA